MVADYAEGFTTQQPHELEMAIYIEKWGLPRAGGSMEQPIKIMRQSQMALYTYKSMIARKQADNVAEWARKNKAIAMFCVEVDRMRNG